MFNKIKKINEMKKKIIYIIGGSGLLGSEIVNQVDKFFFNIVVLDIKKNAKFNNKIKYKKFDCTKTNVIKKQLSSCFKIFGKPDILINCSYPKSKDWNKIDFKKENPKLLKNNIEHHLNSYALITQITCNNIKKKGGSIINVSSIYGEVGQDESLYEGTKIKSNYIYSLIKSGIIGMTKTFASHYGKYNIRINCISPGGIRDKNNKFQNKRFMKNYSNRVPLKRMAKVNEVAAPILFLASEESSYITGTNILVDGGWTCI